MRLRAVLPPTGDARRLVEAHARAIRIGAGATESGVELVSIAAWAGGRGTGDPAQDFLLTTAEVVRSVPSEYAVVGIIADAEREARFAKPRKRMLWVAPNDWAAYRWVRATGQHPYRIIFPPVDMSRFFPSERQRLRKVGRPVVLHRSKGGVVDGVASALGKAFEVRELKCADTEMPDALREGDIWLSLGTAESDAATIVMRALATDMLVVGPNDGLLWPHCPEGHDAVPVAALGAVVFDEADKRDADLLARHIRLAWARRGALRGRKYARRWWSKATCADKWPVLLEDVGGRFDLLPGFAKPPQPMVAVPDSVSWTPPPVPRTDRERVPRVGERHLTRQEQFLRYGRDSSVRV